MSWSACLNCGGMVSMYNKLCAVCEKHFGKENQDDYYWHKIHDEKEIELEKARLRNLKVIPHKYKER